MIKKLACNYTILRFLPYAEPGEFVNLGVALACPDLHWFDYRLETRRLDRITDFFPELKQNKAAFVEGRKLFKDELDRVSKMMNDGKGDVQLRFKEDAKLFNQVFLNLVRPREEVFCFSPPRTCLTEEPKAELERLFNFYVERGFAQRQEYQETLMTKSCARSFPPRRSCRSWASTRSVTIFVRPIFRSSGGWATDMFAQSIRLIWTRRRRRRSLSTPIAGETGCSA